MADSDTGADTDADRRRRRRRRRRRHSAGCTDVKSLASIHQTAAAAPLSLLLLAACCTLHVEGAVLLYYIILCWTVCVSLLCIVRSRRPTAWHCITLSSVLFPDLTKRARAISCSDEAKGG
jgi:hypothetical protein